MCTLVNFVQSCFVHVVLNVQFDVQSSRLFNNVNLLGKLAFLCYYFVS